MVEPSSSLFVPQPPAMIEWAPIEHSDSNMSEEVADFLTRWKNTGCPTNTWDSVLETHWPTAEMSAVPRIPTYGWRYQGQKEVYEKGA